MRKSSNILSSYKTVRTYDPFVKKLQDQAAILSVSRKAALRCTFTNCRKTAYTGTRACLKMLSVRCASHLVPTGHDMENLSQIYEA